ncbi:MAG: tRNA-dihydrouridine synthase family protein [Lachnospiraceae bacterium]|nr:tRNA-dihydrouridine synthase family protein [Lachnospiraceae bacterium]
MNRPIDHMQLTMAPMEGITRYIFRNAHAAVFGGFDRYYTPFLSPNLHHHFRHRESDDINPANNAGLDVVPQILSNVPDDFLWAAEECADRGYTEVNLNLGCPAGTVAKKGKASGMLLDLDRLQAFLDSVFAYSPLPVSIKTRLGWADPAEFDAILALYEQYPVKELIVHARVREEYYKGYAHRDAYLRAAAKTTLPIGYNGDIFAPADADSLAQEAPQTTQIMIGRGILADPALPRKIRGGGPMRPEELREYYSRIRDGYCAVMTNDTHILYKLKELWIYLLPLFPEEKKLTKALKKSKTLAEFDQIVPLLIEALPEQR